MEKWIKKAGIVVVTLFVFQMCTVEPTIVIYGSNTCSHCIDFKAKLDSVGLKYVFNDVDVSDEQTLIMVDLVKKAKYPGRISFPVVWINEKDLLIAPKLSEVLEILE